MKVSIKKIEAPVLGTNHKASDWLIQVDSKTIAVAWNEEDAKLLAKALRRYKKKKDK